MTIVNTSNSELKLNPELNLNSESKLHIDIEPNTRLYPLEKTAIIVLTSIFSLRLLAVFMILPVFTLFAKDLSGATPARIGLALGIYGLIQALLQAPFGYISDRFGRKPVILLGLIIFGIGSVVVAMSQSITGVIWGRSLQGAGAIGSVILALLTDLTREEVRLKAMAILGMSIGTAFALAFILGPFISTWIGVSGMFGLMAVFSGVSIVLLYTNIPNKPLDTLSAKATISDPALQSITSKGIVSVLHPTLLPIYFAVLVIHASLTALFLKLPSAIATFMPENAQTLQFYLPIFLASAVSTFPCLTLIEKTTRHTHSISSCDEAPVSNRSGAYELVCEQRIEPATKSQLERRRVYTYVLVFCLIALLISFFIMYFGLSNWMGLGLGLTLFFTIFNILEASLPSYLSKQVSACYKGTALGIFSALQFLGLCLGGVLGGWLEGVYGTLAVFGFCVILTMILLVWVSMYSMLVKLNCKLRRG